ncbi:unnamed protein product, partial [Gongylonema pulchrum]|uniref:LEM domain-containing protein n=1 Tax=Gongylonema pulchrum TaxID=637853 RepID=A0A183ELA7_9BILA
MLDVDKLTNEEIRAELISRGYEAGPVVDTTRKVYVNQLRRMIEEQFGSGDAHPKSKLSGDADEGSDSDVSPARSRGLRTRRQLRMAADEDDVGSVPQEQHQTARNPPGAILSSSRKATQDNSSESDVAGTDRPSKKPPAVASAFDRIGDELDK